MGAPWIPDDPFDAMAESFRWQVTDMAIKAQDAAIYRDLDPMRQIECFMAGTVTALIGVCFASIEPKGRNEMMKVIRKYLPQARVQVEAMLDARPIGLPSYPTKTSHARLLRPGYIAEPANHNHGYGETMPLAILTALLRTLVAQTEPVAAPA